MGCFRNQHFQRHKHLLKFTLMSVFLMGPEDKLSPLVRCIEPRWWRTCVLLFPPTLCANGSAQGWQRQITSGNCQRCDTSKMMVLLTKVR